MCDEMHSYKWGLYRSMLSVKHPHVKTRYPYNGLEGVDVEHTLNELVLKYDEKMSKFTKKVEGEGRVKYKGGGGGRTYTIVVYT